MAVHALSPFAPHLAEELWEILGGVGELSFTPYPEVEESYLVEETITYVVQVNGKLRGRFELPRDRSKDEILKSARDNPNISRYIEDAEIHKVVFVPNKLLNIVTK